MHYSFNTFNANSFCGFFWHTFINNYIISVTFFLTNLTWVLMLTPLFVFYVRVLYIRIIIVEQKRASVMLIR